MLSINMVDTYSKEDIHLILVFYVLLTLLIISSIFTLFYKFAFQPMVQQIDNITKVLHEVIVSQK